MSKTATRRKSSANAARSKKKSVNPAKNNPSVQTEVKTKYAPKKTDAKPVKNTKKSKKDSKIVEDARIVEELDGIESPLNTATPAEERSTVVDKIERFRLITIPVFFKKNFSRFGQFPPVRKTLNFITKKRTLKDYGKVVIGLLALAIIAAMVVPPVMGAIEYYRLGVWDMF